MMEVQKPPVRWIRSYWEEGDIDYYFEFDEDGWTLRQVELSGPEKRVTTAAALAEWPDPERDGLEAIRQYESKYGGLADQPVTSWDPGFPHEELTAGQFEEVWTSARRQIEAS